MLNAYIGYVTGVTDEYAGGRIKAVIAPDKGKSLSEIPYAFPAMPKMMHVVPKLKEAVIVLVANDEEANGQRLYIGPIISQPDKMNFDSFETLSATRLLNNGVQSPEQSVENFGSTLGALPERQDIAILGRKNTDIILTENELRVRAGSRLTKPAQHRVDFNKDDPAYIKLKYYENGLQTKKNPDLPAGILNKGETIRSTATIVADKINLLSQQTRTGNEHFNLNDTKEGISDSEMQKIIEKAHQLPYGDVLCDFFSLMIKMYMGHIHPWHEMPPVLEDPNSLAFFEKYGSEKAALEEKLLSKDIRIN